MKKTLLLIACIALATSVQADLVFKNTAIKKVGDQYRYFFHVQNTEQSVWQGTVKIGYVADAITMPGILRQKLVVPAGEGVAFYKDWTVAPDSWNEHGDYGIKRWTVTYGQQQSSFPIAEK